MTRTVIDAVSIAAAGGTETGTHAVPGRRRGHEWSYYIDGDADAADLTVSFEAAPTEAGTYHELAGTEEANIDATSPIAFIRDIGAGRSVRVSVTNNGAAASTVTVLAEHSSR